MKLSAFIKLIRVNNLAVIVLTMLATRYGIMQPIIAWQHPNFYLQLTTLDFGLLITSTVLIAAAGYIINDYFDLKTDKINKPKKLYIDNGVKRRVAIFIHTIFNVLGFALSVYVAYKSKCVYLSVIQLVSITALWFYSTHLKRQVLSGNVLVAILSALVPLQVLLFEIPHIESVLQDKLQADFNADFLFLYAAVCSFSLFAFLLSLMREIIKDIEDYKGDFETGCKTMPVVWGVKASKAIVAGLISNTILLLLFIFYKLYKQNFSVLTIYLFVLVFIPLLILIFKLYRSKQKEAFHQLSRWLKYIMIMGVSSTVLIYCTCNGYI